ncbi:MAG: hypothetical protein ACTSPB_17645 [Candidatus Thorarchaeota archaeon]
MSEIQIEPETSYMAHELTRDDLIETETTYTMRGLTHEDLLRIRDGLIEVVDYDDPDLDDIYERLYKPIERAI